MIHGFRLGEIVQGLRGWARPCWRKRYYHTVIAAETHRRALLRRGLARDPMRLHVYQCPHCGRYHIGHASRGGH